MKQRVTTALVLFPLFVGILTFGGWALVAFTLLLYALVNWEYFRFATKLPLSYLIFVLGIQLILPLSYLYLGWYGFSVGVVFGGIMMLLVLAMISERLYDSLSFESFVPACLMGFCYVGLIGSQMVMVAAGERSQQELSWLFCVTIASDTAAYFAGRKWGKSPLAPHLSPNKTIAGAVGGLVAATVVGTAAGATGLIEAQNYLIVLWSLLAGVLVQAGDLIESMVKRVYNIKDSGTLLPGHGGLLDRVDGFMLAAPILYLIV